MSEMSLGLSAAALPDAKPEVRRYFFDVSPLKLIVLSVVTFGFYEIYWFYRNWQVIKERGEDVRPLARAIFSIFFVHALFKRIRETARSTSTDVSAGGGLAAMYIILQLCVRLPGAFWLIAFASAVPLAIAQSGVANIHRSLGLDPSVNNRFTWLNITGVVIGGMLFILAVIGSFLPETP